MLIIVINKVLIINIKTHNNIHGFRQLKRIHICLLVSSLCLKSQSSNQIPLQLFPLMESQQW